MENTVLRLRNRKLSYLPWPFSRTNSESEGPAWFDSRKSKLQSTTQMELERFETWQKRRTQLASYIL